MKPIPTFLLLLFRDWRQRNCDDDPWPAFKQNRQQIARTRVVVIAKRPTDKLSRSHRCR